jgi:hypothetical protein
MRWTGDQGRNAGVTRVAMGATHVTHGRPGMYAPGLSAAGNGQLNGYPGLARRTDSAAGHARDGACDCVAFRHTYTVGTLRKITFAAQWLAYTLPWRRFADILGDASARLGANVIRYSFIATDFHRLLLAGLPAHK